MPIIYGLNNCDTCKKARVWLNQQGIVHQFIDYRAQPLTPQQLLRAAQALGWDKLINRSSSTWRQLNDTDKTAQTAAQWLALVERYPTLLRRPLLMDDAHVDAGFNESRYAAHFAPGALT